MCKDVKIRVKAFIPTILNSRGQFSFLSSDIKQLASCARGLAKTAEDESIDGLKKKKAVLVLPEAII